MSTLQGKTILITGASRGIGLAIAVRCAKAGANIIIAAKEEPNSEHSLQAAYDEIIAAGAKVLTINLDVSDENAVVDAVKKAATHFAGIDILVNNVSAFCFTNTLNTVPEKFDMLFSVNVRATFLLSKLCIPYLKKSSNPHIINIAPPLDMQATWFKDHLAFTMSKYGMSMCALGMAEEFKRDGVAVNSLWPQTTIATTTIKDHFVSEVYAGSRFPTIMADAAFELMQRKAKKCTGNFFIDETLLREAGITDFSHYAVNPGSPLVQDLFIPEKNKPVASSSIPLIRDLFFQENLSQVGNKE